MSQQGFNGIFIKKLFSSLEQIYTERRRGRGGQFMTELKGLITEWYQQQAYKSSARYGISSGVCLVVNHQHFIMKDLL